MPLLILIILIGFPLLEITVFIEVGSEIGATWTILATIFTAVAGIMIVRLQGLAVIEKARANMTRGEPMIEEAVHGIFLFLAGVLLLIPGFVSDAFGILFLLPPVRLMLGRFGLLKAVVKKNDPRASRDQYGNLIIEGRYEVKDIEPNNDNEKKDPD